MRATHLIVFLFLSFLAIMPHVAYASKSYGKPTLSSFPSSPSIRADDGGVFVLNPWHVIFEPQSYPYDIWIQTGCWDKSFPMRLVRYWQISDICEFRPKAYQVGNDAPAVPLKKWILTYSYTDEDLQVFGDVLAFPESSLKIVHSNDYGKTWTMLRSSTVDTFANTVSVVTDKPGGYMVMAGFAPAGAFYNYGEVKGASDSRKTHDVGTWLYVGGSILALLVAILVLKSSRKEQAQKGKRRPKR